MKKRLLLLLIVIPLLLLFVAFGLLLFVSWDTAPPNTSDLVPRRVKVADDQNAYTHFNAAAAALDWPGDKELILDILDGNKSDPQFVADLVARNQKVLRLLERGLRCEVCQPPKVLKVSDPLDYLQEWRKLDRLLALKAGHDREAGRFAEAVEACRQQIRLGELIQKRPVCLVHGLVGIAFLKQGLEQSRELAADADVPSEALARLAQALQQVSPLHQGLVRALKCEYQISANMADDLRDGKLEDNGNLQEELGPIRASYVFQRNKTKAMLARVFRNNLENVALPCDKREYLDIEEMAGFGENRVASLFTPNAVGRTLVHLLVPALRAALEAQCRTEAHLAATRLIVALRRYEKDHDRLPPTLDALVPKYLDAVPADPYDGKPFRYLPDRAVVYSVSTDLRDSGGSEKSTTAEACETEMERLLEAFEVEDEAEDAVFHIHGRPKPKGPAESTEPAETPEPADSP